MSLAFRSGILAFIFTVTGFGLNSRAQSPNAERAKVYYEQGVGRASVGDYDAAIREFTKALEIDPKNAIAYAARGNARTNVGALDEAIADFTKAIELAPNRRAPYINRGVAKVDKDDLDGAIADYSKVLEADPKNVIALRNRGCAKQQKGDFAGALADYDLAVQLSPEEAGAYQRFYLLLLGKRQKIATPAINDLRSTAEKWKEGWKKSVALFLADALPEATFLDLALQGTPKSVREQKCEGFYYAGVVRLLKGDASGAKSLFEKSIATQLHTFPEFQLARTELARLGGAGNGK
ncbi:MAG: tetratricopeptide repeat protein [Nibricoccus sp.]